MKIVEPIMGVAHWDPAVEIEPEIVTVASSTALPVAIDGDELADPVELIRARERGRRPPRARHVRPDREPRSSRRRAAASTRRPGMALLHIAYERLLSAIHNEATLERYAVDGRRLGRLLYEGRWFDPQALMLRDSLQRWVAAVVTGEVTLELRRGDDYTILDTSGEARHVRPGAPEHGAERDRVHRRRPDRAARRAGRTTSPTRARMLERQSARTSPLEAASDALVGSRRRRARAGGVGVPEGRRCRAPALRHAGNAAARASACTPPGILDDAELAEVREVLGASSRRSIPAAEDVHSFIEAELGEVGRKIHAGRSRNDQVAAAFRLYVADACAEAASRSARSRRRARACRARRRTTPMPGYTHLQRAQPVTLGHHLLAWAEMLERDRARFAFAAAQAAPSPLGAGRAGRLDAAAAAAAGADAQLARRRRRPRLRARLPLRGGGALHASLADRRGARPLDDRRVRLRAAARRRRRPGRR